MTALPVGMIRGQQTTTKEEIETNDSLDSTREKKTTLQAKYMGGRKMNKKDKRELEELEKEERLLSRRSNVIEHHKTGWMAKCIRYTRPFQVIIGVILLLIAVVIFVSILLTRYCPLFCLFLLTSTK